MAQIIRVRTLVTGVVQGVGFRPHIARTAARHPVTGLVGNDDREVFIEAQGTREAVHAFLDEALGTLPPLAKITGRRETPVSPVEGEEIFRIVASERAAGERTLIPPDSATCPDCLAELHDPADRRYHHPFITCTNCGPRYSIITDLPYDRPNTTMAGFEMCPRCADEYADPLDRRFHAQPVACPDCGPTMWLERDGVRRDGDPDELFDLARAELDRGGVLAVKGIGGFHLLADARNPDAVALLRERKHRPDKPFAVMAPHPEEVAGFTDAELELVHSPAAPIVIGRDLGVLAPGVAPRLGEVGVMRPYSPLHELLVDRPVIATSGNVPGEPVCHTNEPARAKLARLVDLFVLHDRPIHLPVEDSVFRGTRPVRRGRGFAPLPLTLPLDDAAPADVACVLAVGGELKNAFTLALGERANVAGHLGDMASLAGRRAFDASTADMLTMQRATPTAVACDLHPGYSTRAWAERFAEEHDVPLIGVQHHHAHARSLLAEHGVTGRAVVAVVDGTGFGADATVWGGEMLSVDAGGPDWSRAWHLPVFRMAGGDKAVRNPWRLARGLVAALAGGAGDGPCGAEGVDGADADHAGRAAGADDAAGTARRRLVAAVAEADCFAGVDAAELRLVDSQLASGTGTVECSSAGRLFDAAAFLSGAFTGPVTHEGQAAMEFEALARTVGVAQGDAALAGTDAPSPQAATLQAGIPPRSPAAEGRMPDDDREAVATLLAAVAGRSTPVAERARAFHRGLAELFAARLAAAAEAAGTRVVGVTGGCALNRLFVGDLAAALSARGLELLEHRTVPANDGGLSLGQAAAARAGVDDFARLS